MAKNRSKMQAELRDDPLDPRHGTPNGYINGRCRCDPCLAAGRAYQNNDAQLRMRRAREGRVPDELHGSYNAYSNYGCRCDACVHAATLQRMTWPCMGQVVDPFHPPHREVPLDFGADPDSPSPAPDDSSDPGVLALSTRDGSLSD